MQKEATILRKRTPLKPFWLRKSSFECPDLVWAGFPGAYLINSLMFWIAAIKSSCICWRHSLLQRLRLKWWLVAAWPKLPSTKILLLRRSAFAAFDLAWFFPLVTNSWKSCRVTVRPDFDRVHWVFREHCAQIPLRALYSVDLRIGSCRRR